MIYELLTNLTTEQRKELVKTYTTSGIGPPPDLTEKEKKQYVELPEEKFPSFTHPHSAQNKTISKIVEDYASNIPPPNYRQGPVNPLHFMNLIHTKMMGHMKKIKEISDKPNLLKRRRTSELENLRKPKTRRSYVGKHFAITCAACHKCKKKCLYSIQDEELIEKNPSYIKYVRCARCVLLNQECKKRFDKRCGRRNL